MGKKNPFASEDLRVGPARTPRNRVWRPIIVRTDLLAWLVGTFFIAFGVIKLLRRR